MDCLWQIFPNTDINNNHLHQQRGCLSVAAVATCTGPRGIAASNWQLDGFWKPSTNDDVRNKCNCIYKHIKGDGDCYYQLNGLTTLEKQQPRIKEYSKDFKLTQMGIWPTGSTLFPKGNMRRNLEQECISFFFTIYMHLCQRIHFVSENNIKQLYLACFMNQHISFWAMKTKPLLLQERRITDPWPFRHLRPSLGRFLVPSNLQPHRPSKSVVPDDRCSAVPTSGSFLEPTPWYVVYLYVIIHIIYNIYIWYKYKYGYWTRLMSSSNGLIIPLSMTSMTAGCSEWRRSPIFAWGIHPWAPRGYIPTCRSWDGAMACHGTWHVACGVWHVWQHLWVV